MSSKEFLPYYARHFSTVEINNTFYHLPTRETLIHWRDETPKKFLFTCKASRFITHMKKLKDPRASTEKFFEAVKVLSPKLGPIIFQLPPRWQLNSPRLEEFLQVLPKRFRYAFEFRDASWFDHTTCQLLSAHNAAFCLYHLSGRWAPEILTTDFVYLRLHGPGEAYQGKYDEPMLRTLAAKCRKWTLEGKDVYCFFDNDEKGFATTNALALQGKVNKRRSTQ